MRSGMMIICLLTVSCTSPYPSSVPDIPTMKEEADPYAKGNKVKYSDVIGAIKKYDEKIERKTIDLLNQKYALGDVSMLGAVTSAIAAASGAVTTALYGGGVAIGSGVVSQRYNYDVQLINYQVTREKLNCMYRSMTVLTASQYYIISDSEQSDRRIAKALAPYVYSVLNDLKYELQKQQAAVSLVAPDLTALSGLLEKRKATDKNFIGKSSAYTLAEGESVANDVVYENTADNIMANIGLCKLSPQGRGLSK